MTSTLRSRRWPLPGSDNMVIANDTDGILQSGGVPVLEASYSGNNNTVLMPASGLASH